MLTEIKNLSALMGPSGWEDAVGAYIIEKAKKLGLDAKKDALGNVFVKKPGKKRTEKPVVLTAYMDEPGFMLRSITETGLFRFGLTGDTDPRTILGKTVLVGEAGHRGVVGRKPIHLTDAQERKTMPKTEDLYLDLGAEGREQAEGMAEPGDFAVFVLEFLELGVHKILGKAMGRSVGCGVLLSLLERELPVDVTFLFTVQRQLGSRGAVAAAARVRPGTVIALELCVETEEVKMGEGPALPAVDGSAIYDRELTELIKNSAPGKLQCVGKTENSSDAGAFQRSGGGAKTAVILCPAKYLTAPNSAVDRRDVLSLSELLEATLQAIAG